MIEIRIHGRGGQGAVLASKIIARAFFLKGKEVQAFPFFGVERRGAPVYAYTRVNDSQILQRCIITHPDVLLILDPSLISSEETCRGFKDGCISVFNLPGDQISLPEPFRNGKTFGVDGTGIARHYSLGNPTSPIVNTVMIGAFAKATGYLSVEELSESITQVLGRKHERDVAGAAAAFQETRRFEWA